MKETERSRVMMDFLKKEGYCPELDGDGDIVFKAEGRAYLIILGDQDELFFRLIFPNFWPIESEEERLLVEHIAVEVTAKVKVAKVFIERDTVCAAVEIFSSSMDNTLKVYPRAMAALKFAVRQFAEKMQG